LPNLGPLDDDPVAHSSVHFLILRRATSAWDGPSGGQADEKALGACPGLTPNEIRSASSWGAGRRSRRSSIGANNWCNPGEGELHLRLDSRGAHHTAARRLRDQVVHQRRLPHARFAAQHYCPRLSPARRASMSRWSTADSVRRPMSSARALGKEEVWPSARRRRHPYRPAATRSHGRMRAWRAWRSDVLNAGVGQ